MFVTIPPRFTVKLSETDEQKINKSIAESETIKFRPVCCCYCGTFLFEAGEDIIGHIAVKCQKCKSIVPINAAYFRRSDVIAIMKRYNQYVIPAPKN